MMGQAALDGQRALLTTLTVSAVPMTAWQSAATVLKALLQQLCKHW